MKDRTDKLVRQQGCNNSNVKLSDLYKAFDAVGIEYEKTSRLVISMYMNVCERTVTV